ncbi:hypothetical protein EVAR_41850_1 [Eumeta japonica]|uniref:Uncharacterized protein n=1 Tax=Eumeta variegata TaxID=151549 RepID=A0A4C1XAP5_EUMVA|nr:hypothetical protein EVAR_41850_1 [Eumeta japonica]
MAKTKPLSFGQVPPSVHRDGHRSQQHLSERNIIRASVRGARAPSDEEYVEGVRGALAARLDTLLDALAAEHEPRAGYHGIPASLVPGCASAFINYFGGIVSFYSKKPCIFRLFEELNEQLSFCQKAAQCTASRELTLNELKTYVCGDSSVPLALIGGAGCGKATLVARALSLAHLWLQDLAIIVRGGEGGEKPIMGRLCARAHMCVRLSQTKNLLNNVNLQWREQNAITPSFKTRPYGMEMPSARDCPMGALRVVPRHRRSREAYSSDCMLRGTPGGAGSAPD